MTIAEMTIEDLEQFVSLSSQLGYPEPLVDLRSRFEKMRSNTLIISFVAKSSDGKMTGWIQVNKEPDTILTDDRAEVSGLVVDENHRGQGIGAALLKKAEEWALAQGLPIMRIRTNIKREDAHRFYYRENYKLKKSWHLFIKDL